jgi:hypothetical protein
MLFGEAYYGRSRFIDEINPEFLSFPGQPVAAHPERRERPPRPKTNVGKMIEVPEFGTGVIIEDKGDHYIVAFKTGIKKIPIRA